MERSGVVIVDESRDRSQGHGGETPKVSGYGELPVVTTDTVNSDAWSWLFIITK